MGSQIIKQPDGRFAVFSTFTDTIIIWDATVSDIVEYFERQAAEDARRAVTRRTDLVEAGKAREAYYQFTMTWPEALRKDEQHGGGAWHQFPQDLQPLA
jgi:hypothetical protein